MLKVLNKDKNGRIHFELSGINPGIANALRRSMIEAIPTMAIETVEIAKNSSVLYDEVVAHRLGLIPLKTDLKSYELPKEDNDEFDHKSMLKMNLSAKGPCTVLASDIKSKDPKIVPVFGDIPIVKLLKGQELEFEAVAMMGVGSEHAKWIPGLVWHEYKPTVKVNNGAKLAEFKDNYPKAAFDGDKLSKEKIEKNNLIEACVGVCDEVMSVEYSDKEFVFHVEPWGQLTPQEMLSAATEVLVKDLKTFTSAFKDAKA